MKVANFCKIFIFSLLNLFCYLLSIIFLTATYNIKDQIDYLTLFYDFDKKLFSKYDDSERDSKGLAFCNYKSYLNHYSGIAALFAFSTLGMIFYTVVLLIFIQKYKIEKDNIKNNLENENNRNNNNRNNINNENMGNNEINVNNENYGNRVIPYDESQNLGPNQLIVQSYNSRREYADSNRQIADIRFIIQDENDVLDTDDSAKLLMNILLGAFIACQILYLVQLIVLSVFHHKSKTMENLNNECEFSKFTKIYRDLIIVGYIFFFILIIFYIILLIFYDILGESSKTRLERLKFCKICDDCIIEGCKKCTNIIKTRTDEEERQFIDNEAKTLKGTNEEKDKYIKSLGDYKIDLNDYNTLIKWFGNDNIYEDKMNKLNLYPIIINQT